MVSKSMLAVIAIVAILVIGGGIYMMQQPSTPTTTPTPTTPKPAATTPTEAPAPTETPTQTTTPTPTKTPEETLPGPTLPMGTDEEQVEALMIAYTDAFDRHDAKEAAACFTQDGTYQSSNWGIQFKTGQQEILTGFEDFFNQNPDGTYQDLVIKGLSVNGDRANAILQYKYVQADVQNVGWEETITVIRVGDTWRIQKATTAYSVN